MPHRTSTRKISIETIERAIQSTLDDNLLGEDITIVWHAGEPLTIKPEYFRQLADSIRNKLKPSNVNIFHSIQTNGIPINQEWCDIFLEYNVRIGISIDGPAFIHDHSRITRNGKGTHALAIEGISKLRKNGIPYHAIAVVTEKSLDHAEEIFNFFRENGFFLVGFNIEEIEGENKISSLESNSLEGNIRKFFSNLFALYSNSDGSMKIREFDKALHSILRRPDEQDIRNLKIQSHQLTPFGIISIDVEGNFSMFSPELIGTNVEEYDNFILGNIHKIGFKAATSNPLFKKIDREIRQGVAKCEANCQYFSLCGGGAPSNKFFENGSFDSMETMYCKYSIQFPLEVVLHSLEQRLNKQ